MRAGAKKKTHAKGTAARPRPPVPGGVAVDGAGLLLARPQPDKKNRPNYFVSVRINDDSTVASVRRVQDSITLADARLVSALQPLQMLHVTLATLRIDTLAGERGAAVCLCVVVSDALLVQNSALLWRHCTA